MNRLIFVILIAYSAVSVSTHATKADECRSSQAYKIYESADKISIYRDKVIAAQNALVDDAEAARIGGITNKSKRYKASQNLVRYTRWTNDEFTRYKQLGGTASNPESISKPKSPCW